MTAFWSLKTASSASQVRRGSGYSGTVTAPESTAPASRPPAPVRLDLRQDVALLTAALIDIESVSGNETPLADAVEHALRAVPQLDLVRDGDAWKAEFAVE